MEATSSDESIQTLRVNVNIHPHHPIGHYHGGPSSPGSERSERSEHANGNVPGSPYSRSSSPSGGNGDAETSVGIEPQPSGSQSTHFRPWLTKPVTASSGHSSGHRKSVHHPYRRISTTREVVNNNE